jgi:hypothetical protein
MDADEPATRAPGEAAAVFADLGPLWPRAARPTTAAGGLSSRTKSEGQLVHGPTPRARAKHRRASWSALAQMHGRRQRGPREICAWSTAIASPMQAAATLAIETATRASCAESEPRYRNADECVRPGLKRRAIPFAWMRGS